MPLVCANVFMKAHDSAEETHSDLTKREFNISNNYPILLIFHRKECIATISYYIN